LKAAAAITVTRFALGHDRLVYVFVTDRPLRYPKGRSRIAYIGTTKTGAARISQSVAARSQAILQLHGIRSFEARVLTCKPRRHIKTWFKLERALIVAFRDHFGAVPRCNVKGKKMKANGVLRLFRDQRITEVLRTLS
jgi:hypothetical protein